MFRHAQEVTFTKVYRPNTLIYVGVLVSPYPRPTSRCRSTESIVCSWEEGSVRVRRIASLFLLQRLKGSMSGDACPAEVRATV